MQIALPSRRGAGLVLHHLDKARVSQSIGRGGLHVSVCMSPRTNALSYYSKHAPTSYEGIGIRTTVFPRCPLFKYYSSRKKVDVLLGNIFS